MSQIGSSKEQREGIARVFDTVAASSIIGAVVGLAGYGAIKPRDIVLLLAAIPALLAFSWFLRGAKK